MERDGRKARLAGAVLLLLTSFWAIDVQAAVQAAVQAVVPVAHAETSPPSILAAADLEAPRDRAPSPSPGLQLRTGPDRATNAAVDNQPRPFWKSWVFWTVTGALVAGGVALAAYSLSGSNGDLEPCPGEIAASLGCFGAGRTP